MKKCSKCKVEKQLLEFNNKKTAPDGLSYYCRECEKNYTRNHYKNNVEYYKEKAQRRDLMIKRWFIEYKSKLKCEICGENHPATFDFHHIDPEIKNECISILVEQGSLTKLQTELKKCKVFCANCHRKFHWNEKTKMQLKLNWMSNSLRTRRMVEFESPQLHQFMGQKEMYLVQKDINSLSNLSRQFMNGPIV